MQRAKKYRCRAAVIFFGLGAAVITPTQQASARLAQPSSTAAALLRSIAQAAMGYVNLRLTTDTPTVCLGQEVRVGLHATSFPAAPQSPTQTWSTEAAFDAADIVFSWDQPTTVWDGNVGLMPPTHLQFLGVDYTGNVCTTNPCGEICQMQQMVAAPAFCRTNEAMPPTDGSGYYAIWGPLACAIQAPMYPSDLLITTLRFRALASTEPGSSRVAILYRQSGCRTNVFSSVTPNQSVIEPPRVPLVWPSGGYGWVDITVLPASASTGFLQVPVDKTVTCDGGGNFQDIESWLNSAVAASCNTLTNDFTGLTPCAGVGSATVTWTATDPQGSTATTSATITVLGRTPTLTVPADITATADPGGTTKTFCTPGSGSGMAACCFASGTCQTLTPTNCRSAGGGRQSFGTNCATPNVCTAACTTTTDFQAVVSNVCMGPLTLTFTRSDGRLNLYDPYDSLNSPISITWLALDGCGNFAIGRQRVYVYSQNAGGSNSPFGNQGSGGPLGETPPQRRP